MALRTTESDEDALHIGSFLKWPFRRFNGFSSLGHVFNRAVAPWYFASPSRVRPTSRHSIGRRSVSLCRICPQHEEYQHARHRDIHPDRKRPARDLSVKFELTAQAEV